MDPTAPAPAHSTSRAEPAAQAQPVPPPDDTGRSNTSPPPPPAGSSMSANDQQPGSADQIGRPNRPWSLTPEPGTRSSHAFGVPSGKGGAGESESQSGGLSVPSGYEGRRHSIASGEIVQGHHNGHSHSTANARAGPPSNAAHLLSPYHDQYTAPTALPPRQALKRKLSHGDLPSADTSGPSALAPSARSAMQVDSNPESTAPPPSKRRTSAVDPSRLPQMSVPDHENAEHSSSPSAPPNIWPGGPPRWGSGPYPQGAAPPPSHIADERRDSAASIFSATSMASSASGTGGYTPSTAPTSFSSNGEDPNRNYQSFVWPPGGGPPPHGYANASAPYFAQQGNASFTGDAPAGEDKPNEHTPPPGTTTPENSHPANNGEPTPTSATSNNAKDTPYSRSPELRISHKLAERKRRKEMKDLFDELRDQLPADRGMKASKWEILSKAVEYIASMKGVIKEQQRELEHMRHEVEVMHNTMPGATVAPPGSHMHTGPPPPHMMGIPPPHAFYRPAPPGPPPGVFASRQTPPREREGDEERQ